MRDLNDERGAVALIVALTTMVLIGVAALVVDLGALVQDRRELQNGADAAALAVARDCAEGACPADAPAVAGAYADANALDGAADLADLCGTVPGLAACATPTTVPGATGLVGATTSSRDAATGEGRVRFRFARALASGLTGATVTARATAAWGPPAGVFGPPLTFSWCEVEAATAGGTSFSAGPPFASTPVHITFHDPAGPGVCPAGPSGADLPGGFGWLDAVEVEDESGTGDSCAAQTEIGSWAEADTGTAAPTVCDLTDWRGKTVLLPVFDQSTGVGTNGEYHIAGYAAFHITGYRFPAAAWPSSGAQRIECPGVGSAATCIRGHFVRHVTSGGQFGVGAPDFGVRTVALVPEE